MTFRFLSSDELRRALADLNRLPMTPAIQWERAEVCRELALRSAMIVAGR